METSTPIISDWTAFRSLPANWAGAVEFFPEGWYRIANSPHLGQDVAIVDNVLDGQMADGRVVEFRINKSSGSGEPLVISTGDATYRFKYEAGRWYYGHPDPARSLVDERLDEYAERLRRLREREITFGSPDVLDDTILTWLRVDATRTRGWVAHLKSDVDDSPETRRQILESRNADRIFEQGIVALYGPRSDNWEAVAFGWIMKAAELGHTYAMLEVSRSFFRGRGVTQNDKDALRWHRRALAAKWDDDRKDFGATLCNARAGDPKAACRVGMRFRQGAFFEPDQETAFAWFMHAAELGLREGIYMCFDCCLRGLGVPQDFFQAMMFYQQWHQMDFAADMEEVWAEQGRAVELAQSGDTSELERIENELREGEAEFETEFQNVGARAAEGSADAQYEIGLSRLAGPPGKRRGSVEEVIEQWFKPAAEANHGEALFTLGSMYLLGEGVEPDEELANRYLTRAAASPYLLFQKLGGRRCPTGINSGPELFSFDDPFEEPIEDLPFIEARRPD